MFNAVKITLVALFALFAFQFAAQAQGHAHGHGKKHKAQEMAQRLKEDLDLTDEQAEKVKAAAKAHRQKMKAAREVNAGNHKAMREARKAAHEAFEAELKTILSEEQFAKFQAHKEEMQSPESRAERRADRMAEELKLSDAQAEKVEALIKSKIEARQADREKHKAEREAFEKEMKAILTPEQYEAFLKMKEEKREKRKGRRGGK